MARKSGTIRTTVAHRRKPLYFAMLPATLGSLFADFDNAGIEVIRHGSSRMRIYISLTVYVVAFAIGQTSSEAAGDRNWVTSITPVSVSDSTTDPCPTCQQQASTFNGFNAWRQRPDLGAPGSSAFGFQHFGLPMHHYTTWYRPRAATLTKCRRCAKDPFRPRGLGHLGARPCDGFRMEYTPYVLRDDQSQYGPSYIARQPDPRCDHHCDHSDDPE